MKLSHHLNCHEYNLTTAATLHLNKGTAVSLCIARLQLSVPILCIIKHAWTVSIEIVIEIEFQTPNPFGQKELK